MFLEFTTNKIAQNALKDINNKLGYPLVSINGATGLPDVTKQQTTQWSDVNEAEGKFYIPDPSIKTSIKKEDLLKKFSFVSKDMLSTEKADIFIQESEITKDVEK